MSPEGEVRQLPGLTIASANTSLPTFNAAFMTAPGEWEEQVEAARSYFAVRRRPGVLVACEDWVDEDARRIIAASGAQADMHLTGMAAESLVPALRDLPDLVFRRVEDEDTRLALADMNSLSYGIPIDWGREAVGTDQHWAGTNFGHIGYLNDQPVTAAATLAVGSVLYVAWVATLPSHRQRGYAEAVMRYSLSEARRATGIERSALHATAAGYPIYLRMGYQPLRGFVLFGWALSH